MPENRVYRVRVRLDTGNDLNKFTHLVDKMPFPVYLSDTHQTQRVSAQSTLGRILAQIEWEEIYCECEHDIEKELRAENLVY